MASGAVKGLLALISLMTRIPLRGKRDLLSAAKHFYLVPLVGLLTGLVSWGAALPVTLVLRDAGVGAATYLITYLLFTGGIHVDGLADYFDALGAGAQGEAALRVLKDPRKGAFAVTAVAADFILTYALASHVLATAVGAATPALTLRTYAVLAASHVASAEAMFVSAALGTPEPYEGMGKAFVELSGSLRMVVLNAAVMSATAVAYFTILGPRYVAALAFIAGFSVLASLPVITDAERRLGFVNGDVLGTTYEVGRLAALLALSALLGVPA